MVPIDLPRPMTDAVAGLYFIFIVFLTLGGVVVLARDWVSSVTSLTVNSIPLLMAVFIMLLPFVWTVVGWLVPRRNGAIREWINNAAARLSSPTR